MPQLKLTNPWQWKIPLHGRADGLYVLIDPEDFPELARYRWNLNADGYVQRWLSGKHSLMHREILGLSPGDGLQGDHKNLNKLDCRRSNLRITTHAQNGQNRPPNKTYCGVPTVSEYRGVTWRANRKKWIARVMVEGKSVWIGTFDTEEQAAEAASEARRELLPYSEEENHGKTLAEPLA